MTREQMLVAVNRAYERRLALIKRLGNRCWYQGCEVSGDDEALEFDHLAPRTWRARDVNRWTRQKLYERDAALGILGLACRSCNAAGARPDRFDPMIYAGMRFAPPLALGAA